MVSIGFYDKWILVMEKIKRSSVVEQRNFISGFSGRFRSHGPIMVIPKLAHGGRLGSLIGCFGSVFEPSSKCQPGRQLLGALISGPNKSSSGLRFGPNGNKKPKKGVRVGAIRMRSACDPGAIQWVLERSGPRDVCFCERSCPTTYPLYNINRKPLP